DGRAGAVGDGVREQNARRHRTFQGAVGSRRKGARRSQPIRFRERPPSAELGEKIDGSVLVPQWLEKWKTFGRGGLMGRGETTGCGDEPDPGRQDARRIACSPREIQNYLNRISGCHAKQANAINQAAREVAEGRCESSVSLRPASPAGLSCHRLSSVPLFS